MRRDILSEEIEQGKCPEFVRNCARCGGQLTKPLPGPWARATGARAAASVSVLVTGAMGAKVGGGHSCVVVSKRHCTCVHALVVIGREFENLNGVRVRARAR